MAESLHANILNETRVERMKYRSEIAQAVKQAKAELVDPSNRRRLVDMTQNENSSVGYLFSRRADALNATFPHMSGEGKSHYEYMQAQQQRKNSPCARLEQDYQKALIKAEIWSRALNHCQSPEAKSAIQERADKAKYAPELMRYNDYLKGMEAMAGINPSVLSDSTQNLFKQEFGMELDKAVAYRMQPMHLNEATKEYESPSVYMARMEKEQAEREARATQQEKDRQEAAKQRREQRAAEAAARHEAELAALQEEVQAAQQEAAIQEAPQQEAPQQEGATPLTSGEQEAMDKAAEVMAHNDFIHANSQEMRSYRQSLSTLHTATTSMPLSKSKVYLTALRDDCRKLGGPYEKISEDYNKASIQLAQLEQACKETQDAQVIQSLTDKAEVLRNSPAITNHQDIMICAEHMAGLHTEPMPPRTQAFIKHTFCYDLPSNLSQLCREDSQHIQEEAAKEAPQQAQMEAVRQQELHRQQQQQFIYNQQLAYAQQQPVPFQPFNPMVAPVAAPMAVQPPDPVRDAAIQRHMNMQLQHHQAVVGAHNVINQTMGSDEMPPAKAGFTDDRVKAGYFCAGALAAKGYSLEDIFDSTKLVEEKALMGQEFRTRATAGDTQWYAKNLLTGQMAMSSQMDNLARGIDLSDADQAISKQSLFTMAGAVTSNMRAESMSPDVMGSVMGSTVSPELFDHVTTAAQNSASFASGFARAAEAENRIFTGTSPDLARDSATMMAFQQERSRMATAQQKENKMLSDSPSFQRKMENHLAKSPAIQAMLEKANSQEKYDQLTSALLGTNFAHDRFDISTKEVIENGQRFLQIDVVPLSPEAVRQRQMEAVSHLNEAPKAPQKETPAKEAPVKEAPQKEEIQKEPPVKQKPQAPTKSKPAAPSMGGRSR